MKFFKEEPGICLHGFKPQQYMERFKEMAREVRKSLIPLELSKLEESILSVLNIPVNDVKQWVDSEIRKIEIIKQMQSQSQPPNRISGGTIRAALNLNDKKGEKGRETQFNQLKKPLLNLKQN